MYYLLFIQYYNHPIFISEYSFLQPFIIYDIIFYVSNSVFVKHYKRQVSQDSYLFLYERGDYNIMNYTTLSNFLNNAENIINNALTNEDYTTIKTEEGNVVLMSEQQYECLVEALVRNREEQEKIQKRAQIILDSSKTFIIKLSTYPILL